MTATDQAVMARSVGTMAATNGYRPEQASDLYITSGSTHDYEYGVYRIMAYTFELSIKDYPDDSKIRSETGRNKEAVLYLMEHAGCPYSVLGVASRVARCGAFDDDLEVARGWTVNPDGTDTAPALDRFARGDPQATTSLGPKQLGTTPSGRAAFVTGLKAGPRASAYDLDGTTTIRSPAISLPAGSGQRLTFRYVFAHDARSSVGRHAQGHRRGRGRDADPGRHRARERRRRGRSHGGSPRPRSMPGPGRRSTSGSRRPTAAPATSSRSSSTTSG